MKAELDSTGMLTITAENGTEMYALKLWHANLEPRHPIHGVTLSSIRVAPFIEPAHDLPLPEATG